MMAVIVSTVGGAAPQQDDELLRLNLEKARAVAMWLDSQPVSVTAAARSAICADLSDLYSAATGYKRLVDDLLAGDPAKPEQVADRLAELETEIEHIGWHARSVVKRLNRLASDLYPDEQGGEGE
jgi:hypothetical protein